MSTAENILADPVTVLEHMVREDARRQLKRSDALLVRRVAAALRQRADECGIPRDTCGGCKVVLAVAAALDAPEPGS